MKGALLSIRDVKPYTPKDLSGNCRPECYFICSDAESIIEFEINAGIIEVAGVEEISIRLAVTSSIESFEKALKLCRFISDRLFMKTVDLRLREELNYSDELQILRCKKAFEQKKVQFYNTYSIPFDLINTPMYCGKAFFDELRKK